MKILEKFVTANLFSEEYKRFQKKQYLQMKSSSLCSYMVQRDYL